MLNIVIPMAGRGSRFSQAGYTVPKPLIDVKGHCMIEWVVRNLTPKAPHRFIFLCLQEHLEQYGLEAYLRGIAPGCAIVPVDRVTEGAACTVLLAESLIDSEDELMIANSDQYCLCDINDYLAALGDCDGLIMTTYAGDNKWSYIAFDENRLVTLVREKEVISEEATVGVYNFRRGSDFVLAARSMISRDLRVNGEFYVAPVYNLLIEEGKRIAFCHVGRAGDGIYGLGTPEDLEAFLRNPVSDRPLP